VADIFEDDLAALGDDEDGGGGGSLKDGGMREAQTFSDLAYSKGKVGGSWRLAGGQLAAGRGVAGGWQGAAGGWQGAAGREEVQRSWLAEGAGQLATWAQCAPASVLCPWPRPAGGHHHPVAAPPTRLAGSGLHRRCHTERGEGPLCRSRRRRRSRRCRHAPCCRHCCHCCRHCCRHCCCSRRGCRVQPHVLARSLTAPSSPRARCSAPPRPPAPAPPTS